MSFCFVLDRLRTWLYNNIKDEITLFVSDLCLSVVDFVQCGKENDLNSQNNCFFSSFFFTEVRFDFDFEICFFSRLNFARFCFAYISFLQFSLSIFIREESIQTDWFQEE